MQRTTQSVWSSAGGITCFTWTKCSGTERWTDWCVWCVSHNKHLRAWASWSGRVELQSSGCFCLFIEDADGGCAPDLESIQCTVDAHAGGEWVAGCALSEPVSHAAALCSCEDAEWRQITLRAPSWKQKLDAGVCYVSFLSGNYLVFMLNYKSTKRVNEH